VIGLGCGRAHRAQAEVVDITAAEVGDSPVQLLPGLDRQAEDRVGPEDRPGLCHGHVGLPDMGAVGSRGGDQVHPIVQQHRHARAADRLDDVAGHRQECIIVGIGVAHLDERGACLHGLPDRLRHTERPALHRVGDQVDRKIQILAHEIFTRSAACSALSRASASRSSTAKLPGPLATDAAFSAAMFICEVAAIAAFSGLVTAA